MSEIYQQPENIQKFHNRTFKPYIDQTNYSTDEAENLKSDDKYNKTINKRNPSKFSFKELCFYVLETLSIYLYILSLEGCHDTQTHCLVNLNPQFFHKIVIYLTISTFINSFMVFMIIKRKIEPFIIIYMILSFAYLTLFHDTGSDLSHHGSYNRLVFYVMLFTNLFIIYIFNQLLKLLQKKHFKLILGFILVFVISIYSVNLQLKRNCEKWTIGLKGKKIFDTENFNSCSIVKPSSCWIELIDGLLDVSWFLQENCENFRIGERTELMKFLPRRYHNSNKFGYPITTNFTYVPESYHLKFFYNLLDNFIDLENPNNNNLTNQYSKNRPEIILEFDEMTKLGKIQINITKNEELVKERNKKSNNDTLVKNILMIYVDSISRQHFIRKMKKTSNFIEKYIKETGTIQEEETNSDSANLLAYQFLKYHAFIYFTQPNTNPMFYGESMVHNNGTHIIKHFHDKGFITGQANNICTRELYDIEDGYIKNLNWEPFDHENIAMFCDPNYFSPNNPYTPYMGPYSIKKRCLYGKDTFEYVLEYGEEFWKTYPNNKKFLRLAFQDAHEGTGEVARYLDDKLSDFLENFENRGWLDNTAIIFVSDHGNNMIGFYNIFNVEDFVLEKTLASLFIMLPSSVANKYQNQIYENEQVMITPYDIYDTLLHLIDEKEESEYYSRFGSSLLKRIKNSGERNCDTYKLDLSDIWCRCKKN